MGTYGGGLRIVDSCLWFSSHSWMHGAPVRQALAPTSQKTLQASLTAHAARSRFPLITTCCEEADDELVQCPYKVPYNLPTYNVPAYRVPRSRLQRGTLQFNSGIVHVRMWAATVT